MGDSAIMTTEQQSRRKFLKRTSSCAGALLLSSKAPFVFAKKKTTLRVMGTHVTLQEELRQQAMSDLGIELIFEPGGEAELIQKATTQPESFDLYEQWTDSIRQLWQANAIQAIETDRLTYWDEINNISRTGRIQPDAKTGLGDAPYKILNIQDDGSLGEKFTGKISFLPYVHNVDSFGYNTDIIPQGTAYDTESWSWLLDEKWQGKVGIVNAPTIGIFDLALAAQSKGLMQFQDMSDMTISEIDTLFSILMEYKNQNHFSGFWNSVPQSVDYITSGRVAIQSMFSPGVSAANGLGTPVTYAAPKEGYRAWHGVMCMSRACDGHVKDAAYEYMNWWLSGWPGAFIARQGYYISNPERSRPLLDDNEWGYWYEGKETNVALKGTDGRISVNAGEVRNGGSYTKRFSNVAIWNTVMPNYDYSLQKWYEFLLA
ncbi:ABC transporter substrate-binding protein [Methylophaga sp. OBS3]|uniref:ABC transporter substrate-binding protein n=1 Tax=Methylophaga sp. OBS3 TaxID=2991934 RepID=UPI0022595AD8|nr:extracellular solute-binding protein [Methylophaga sp. OBS3]MCX4189238.1 extracellular solute-binding protein [Methylophaga sp. OBS3]